MAEKFESDLPIHGDRSGLERFAKEQTVCARRRNKTPARTVTDNEPDKLCRIPRNFLDKHLDLLNYESGQHDERCKLYNLIFQEKLRILPTSWLYVLTAVSALMVALIFFLDKQYSSFPLVQMLSVSMGFLVGIIHVSRSEMNHRASGEERRRPPSSSYRDSRSKHAQAAAPDEMCEISRESFDEIMGVLSELYKAGPDCKKNAQQARLRRLKARPRGREMTWGVAIVACIGLMFYFGLHGHAASSACLLFLVGIALGLLGGSRFYNGPDELF